MSELSNPLFEDQKEFLERQKQEYKNALLNDVSVLKSKSQQVGTTLLIAGGALAGIWMVSSLFRGKKKDPKRLKGRKAPLLLNPPAYRSADDVVQPDGSLDYNSALHQNTSNAHNQYTNQATTDQQHSSGLGGMAQAFFSSDMARALSQQVTAFLLVYLSKKAEEYLQVHKNTDIAASQESETKDIDFSYHEEDAVQP